MKLAIMQPYFLPYIGYFQLIAAADQFIVYDNIKYTKKGWINRNRLLTNGSDTVFTLPLKKGSDSLNVNERVISTDFDCNKLLNQFIGAYMRAPYFDQTFPLLGRILNYEERNLFYYIHHSIVEICIHLGITTTIRISSQIEIDHNLKGQDKVIALCNSTGADSYINSIGGLSLYSRDAFQENNIDLKFLQSKYPSYIQFDEEFVPWLSIIDILMFNPLSDLKACLANSFELI